MSINDLNDTPLMVGVYRDVVYATPEGGGGPIFRLVSAGYALVLEEDLEAAVREAFERVEPQLEQYAKSVRAKGIVGAFGDSDPAAA